MAHGLDTWQNNGAIEETRSRHSLLLWEYVSNWLCLQPNPNPTLTQAIVTTRDMAKFKVRILYSVSKSWGWNCSPAIRCHDVTSSWQLACARAPRVPAPPSWCQAPAQWRGSPRAPSSNWWCSPWWTHCLCFCTRGIVIRLNRRCIFLPLLSPLILRILGDLGGHSEMEMGKCKRRLGI